ncbi:hypothetical protein [Candidatus Palauibacter sp.]|uniref:hypothetical protein n=1 Tax=Candidatus Palauibacter sp. TaxID=3101350 RepID=UPI003B58E430
MLGSPRVIAIDDNSEHLSGLTDGLNRRGVACLQIHFTGDPGGVVACPDVRIVFADLHLGLGNPSDHKANFSMIGGLLRDTIKPRGPYLIILWTRFPEQAEALRDFLDRPDSGVPKPFDVRPLSKTNHLDAQGCVVDEGALVNAVVAIVRESPQLAALFDWESRVLGATGGTVSSILELAATDDEGARAVELGKILSRLAVEAVGARNVEADRFRAVNEALLPILADRIAKLQAGDGEEEIWHSALQSAVDLPSLRLEGAAKLNSLVHIAETGTADGTERGVAVRLSKSYQRRFERCFGLTQEDAAAREFRCNNFDGTDHRFSWVLVQCAAACDHAQVNPGTMPFYLGLDFPEEHQSSRKPPASTWCGPAFHFDGQIRVLRVSARFPLALWSCPAFTDG